ncbi:hypothetical protein WG66_010059 [Moniliophthora roreri]|nr:hypothetical protein WG66_010059 [Moniliophthora roreri]
MSDDDGQKQAVTRGVPDINSLPQRPQHPPRRQVKSFSRVPYRSLMKMTARKVPKEPEGPHEGKESRLRRRSSTASLEGNSTQHILFDMENPLSGI